MKVFISWSGSPSKEIAEVLNRYIPDIIQEVETFYSPDNINKGEQWSSAINGELNNSNFGILCITKNNFRSDWINYEAGALTKPVEKSKICPLLFDMQTSDITHSPLTMYQMTLINKDDMLKLFKSMSHSCEKPMTEERLIRAFDKNWNDIEKAIEDIRQNFNNKEDIETVATQDDMIREILGIVRNNNNTEQSMFTDAIIDLKYSLEKVNDINRSLINANLNMYIVRFHKIIRDTNDDEIIKLIAENCRIRLEIKNFFVYDDEIILVISVKATDCLRLHKMFKDINHEHPFCKGKISINRIM